MGEWLYFRVTNDKYQLPIGVCSRDELKKVHGDKADDRAPREWRVIKDVGEERLRRKEACPPWVDKLYLHCRLLLKAKGIKVSKLVEEYGISRNFFLNTNYLVPDEERIKLMCQLVGEPRERLFDFNYLPDEAKMAAEIFGRARDIIKQRGYTVRGYAKMLEVNYLVFYNTNRKATITQFRINQLCELLEVSREELLKEK